MIYKLIIGACLSLALKLIIFPDWSTVAALFVFASSGLVVYFLEQVPYSVKAFKTLDVAVCNLIAQTERNQDRFVKLEAHLERLDNRTRTPGR